MNNGRDRRRKPRIPRVNLAGLRLVFQERQGVRQTLPVQLVDLNENGCGLEVDAELKVNMPVTLMGDLTNQGGGREMQVNARVAWCAALSEWAWRVGLEFEVPLAPGWDKKSAPREERTPLDDAEDYYEILQLSSNADGDTIHRVFRLLAARYHPDNQESGNADVFRKLHEAYKTLSDPEKRAGYDASYQKQKKLRWKIFDQPNSAQGMHAERAKRHGILSLLYRKRASTPDQPAVSIVELEDLLGVPREHLDFSLWFLRESALVARTDNGRFSITVKGAIETETAYIENAKPAPEDRMLPEPVPAMTYA